jgi:translation initiation factor IF-2
VPEVRFRKVANGHFQVIKERMGAVTSKTRLYDLAKELKIDTKRLIEEVRREGVDVSVPSNSISKELAEKIREKYFPKKDTAVKRAVRVVKKAARPVIEEAPAEEPAEAIAEAEPIQAEPAIVEEPEMPASPTVRKVLRKLPPAVRAEAPATPGVAPPPIPEDHREVVAASSEVASPAPEPIQPPARQVRVLRPTAAALSAGIRPGERAPAPEVPPPATPTVRERPRERAPRARVEYAGTPGETATPQTTYIPPPDAGRRRSRRASPRGAKREGKGS